MPVRRVADGIAGGAFDGGEHVEHPVFPGVVLSDGLEKAVVVGLGADDMATEVEDGDAEQVFFYQVADIEDAAGAAIAIVRRGGCFRTDGG